MLLDLFLIGLVVTLEPIPLSAFILLLAAERGLLKGLGFVIGIPVAWVASRLVSSMLFGVKGTDLLTIGAATIVLAATGLVAAFLPAWRASRVDPMVALRYE